jgi:hypothetical protein
MNNEKLEQAVAGYCERIMQREAEEIAGESQFDLENHWHFKFDAKKPMEDNLYEFYSMLDIYASHCRRWEVRHHGITCVVERVRDNYILPKIRELISAITMQSLTPAAKLIAVESTLGSTINVPACPCCGGVELYAGYADSETVQVRCCNCGLRMNVDTEAGWEEAVGEIEESDSDGKKALDIAARLSLDIAAARWSQRAAGMVLPSFRPIYPGTDADKLARGISSYLASEGVEDVSSLDAAIDILHAVDIFALQGADAACAELEKRKPIRCQNAGNSTGELPEQFA